MNAQTPIEAIDWLLEIAQRIAKAKQSRDQDRADDLRLKMLKLLWSEMREADRRWFLSRVDQSSLEFVPELKGEALADYEMVRIMQSIDRSVEHLGQEQRDFVYQMLSKWKLPNWAPTAAQEKYLRSLHQRADAIARQHKVPDMDLIDKED